jgi:hypothetical protein
MQPLLLTSVAKSLEWWRSRGRITLGDGVER